MEEVQRQVKSNVWCIGDSAAWMIAESPLEVSQMVKSGRAREEALIELTLANKTRWNGRAVYLDPFNIVGISPPASEMSDEDEDDGEG